MSLHIVSATYTQLKDRIDAKTWYRPFLSGGLYRIVGTLS